VAQTLIGVSNSVHRISNTSTHPHTHTIRPSTRGRDQCVRQDRRGRTLPYRYRSPIVKIRRRICIGFAFGYESGSRTLFYEDG